MPGIPVGAIGVSWVGDMVPYAEAQLFVSKEETIPPSMRASRTCRRCEYGAHSLASLPARCQRRPKARLHGERWGQLFLSAVIGSTFAARRAGMIDAASDAIARIPVAAPRASGSSGLIS